MHYQRPTKDRARLPSRDAKIEAQKRAATLLRKSIRLDGVIGSFHERDSCIETERDFRLPLPGPARSRNRNRADHGSRRRNVLADVSWAELELWKSKAFQSFFKGYASSSISLSLSLSLSLSSGIIRFIMYDRRIRLFI